MFYIKITTSVVVDEDGSIFHDEHDKPWTPQMVADYYADLYTDKPSQFLKDFEPIFKAEVL